VICRSVGHGAGFSCSPRRASTEQAARIVLLLQTVCPAIYNALPPTAKVD
jgi:hypothetical protein